MNVMKPLILVPALLLAAALAHAAPEPAAPGQMDLPHQVERLAAGKPVPVVVVADERTAARRPVPDTAGKELLPALQAISAAFFDDPAPGGTPGILLADVERDRTEYQPFAFETDGGRAWTVAADRAWVDMPASSRTARPIPAFVAQELFTYSLSREQLARATTTGLRWQDYTDRQKALLKAFFGRPWVVTVPRSENPATSNGDGESNDSPITISSSTSPLPIESCRLFIYFGFQYLRAPEADDGSMDLYSLRAEGPSLVMPDDATDWLSFSRTVYERKLKPSDLSFDAQALRRPIGISGVTTAAALVAVAAKVSALPLRLDARYASRAVFVGDAAMNAGDALKLLTFALDAAWRKLGSIYLLAWDRKGLAIRALEQQAIESRPNGPNAQLEAWQQEGDAARGPNWLAMVAETLKPDPAAPIGPTRAQLAAVNAPSPDAESRMFSVVSKREREVYRFSNLDPDQQEAVRKAVRNDPDAVSGAHALTPARLAESWLSSPNLYVEMEMPGAGRVEVPTLGWSSFLLTRIRHFRDIDRKRRDDAEAVKRQALLAQPLEFAHAVRAVAPPPLPPGEWARLLDAMRRKGLNTLYVPALWDGMTLFPSTHLPMLPVCNGRDVLGEVLEAARTRHIRVVAVLRTLAWRLPGSEVHWLSKHPELVDVDAMGRTRRAWRLGIQPDDGVFRGESGDFLRRDPFAAADYVRPTAPEVQTRLRGLISELRRYDGLSGVAVANWSRFSAQRPYAIPFGGADAAPSLGYGLSERVAFLAAHGVDPVDVAYPTDPEGFGRGPDLPREEYGDAWNAFRHAEDLRLVRRLIADAEETWPGRVELFNFLEPSKTIPLPPADATITWEPMPNVTGPTYRRVPLPSAPPLPDTQAAAPPPTAAQARRQRLDAFNLALHQAASSARATGIFKADGIVLDFTASPDLMWEALKMLP